MPKITKTYSIEEDLSSRFEEICQKNDLNRSKIIEKKIVEFMSDYFVIDRSKIYAIPGTSDYVKILKKEIEKDNVYLYLSNGNKIKFTDFEKVYTEEKMDPEIFLDLSEYNKSLQELKRTIPVDKNLQNDGMDRLIEKLNKSHNNIEDLRKLPIEPDDFFGKDLQEVEKVDSKTFFQGYSPLQEAVQKLKECDIEQFPLKKDVQVKIIEDPFLGNPPAKEISFQVGDYVSIPGESDLYLVMEKKPKTIQIRNLDDNLDTHLIPNSQFNISDLKYEGLSLDHEINTHLEAIGFCNYKFESKNGSFIYSKDPLRIRLKNSIIHDQVSAVLVDKNRLKILMDFLPTITAEKRCHVYKIHQFIKDNNLLMGSKIRLSNHFENSSINIQEPVSSKIETYKSKLTGEEYHTISTDGLIDGPADVNLLNNFKDRINTIVEEMKDSPFQITTKTSISSPLEGSEPTQAQISERMASHQEDFYNARERLREIAYGGAEGVKPEGYESWGDYWKNR